MRGRGKCSSRKFQFHFPRNDIEQTLSLKIVNNPPYSDVHDGLKLRYHLQFVRSELLCKTVDTHKRDFGFHHIAAASLSEPERLAHSLVDVVLM